MANSRNGCRQLGLRTQVHNKTRQNCARPFRARPSQNRVRMATSKVVQRMRGGVEFTERQGSHFGVSALHCPSVAGMHRRLAGGPGCTRLLAEEGAKANVTRRSVSAGGRFPR